MENFEEKIDTGGDDKETKSKLNDLQKELIKENEKEIIAIRNAIASLKSFNDLPLTINYPTTSKEKIAQKKFPKKLDMRPKPFLDKGEKKRKDIKGDIVENPDPLMICLDNRKFTVSPDVGHISNLTIDNGKIILDISKFGVIIKIQEYNPERMTKLLTILWTHESGLNKDITNTKRADVKEVK